MRREVAAMGADANERERRMAARLERPMLLVALLVIPAVVLDESRSGSTAARVASVLNWVIWLAFVAEALVLLSVAGDRRRWLRRHPLDLAIIVLTPPFAPPIAQAGRALRLLRLLRLFRTGAALRRLFSAEGLAWAAAFAGLTVLAGGAAFAQVERAQHVSASDGAWWAISTVTTVGYGDIAPRTALGRVLAVFVMLVGIGFVALLTGAIAQRFLAHADAADERRDSEILDALDTLNAHLAALNARLDALTPGSTLGDPPETAT